MPGAFFAVFMRIPLMRITLCVVWLSVAATGAWVLASYGSAPGKSGPTPQHWPVGSNIAAPTDRPILVMFAHPKCPCTRASIAELNELLTSCQDKLAVHVLFIQPRGVPGDWAKDALWKNASVIPGGTGGVDPDGMEAHSFGPEWS